MKKAFCLLLLCWLVIPAASLLSAEDTAAMECADLAVRSADEAKGKPYVVENEKFIIIGNGHIAAGFGKENLGLTALVDVASGGHLLAAGQGPVWKVALAKNRDKDNTISVGGTDGAERSYALNRGKEGVTLYLRWAKVPSAEEGNIIRALVRVTADAGSRYLCWKMDVDCKSSERGLWQVDFPVIDSILPMGEAEETKLFLPQSTGVVVSNPFAEDVKSENWLRYRGASMQFSCVYGPAGGLYLATQDGSAFTKSIHYKPDKASQTLSYYLRNIPENRGAAGLNYRMPYEFVMTTFEGDWFTASKIYRQWAIKQVWCSKGPLHSRKDVPAWFKELGYWMIAWEMKAISRGKEYEEVIKPKIGPDKDQMLDDIRRISSRIGVPTAVHLYGWHNNWFDSDLGEYFPPLIGKEAFKKQVKAIHDMGVRIMPYINGWMWSESVPSYKELNVERYSIKDERGNVRKQGALGDWMCAYTDLWQNKLADISEKLVRDYNADGVYYDQVSGTAYNCFDSTHGHPVGANMFEGERELLTGCRERIRQINPEAIMTGECLSEVFMDCFDGLLLSIDQSRTGTVPAFQAVYHDYFILFGNMNLNYEEPVRVTPMALGESFTAGDQLGWFNTWPIFTPDHPRNMGIYWKDPEVTKKIVDFTVQIAQLRYHAGRKFLVYGEMQRPLVFDNKLPYLEGWWQKFREPEVRRLPAVMNSVWKAPDGTLGLVFCNISDNEHTVEFNLNLKDYNTPEAKKYSLVEREADGTEKVIKEFESTSFTEKVKMPPLTGYILEVRAE